jgi:ribosomal protein S12 methylthiotransferase
VRKLKRTINSIRTAIPDIKLRTTLIVGFPGETEADFEALKGFIQEIRFDKLGVFTYSQEENTPAARLKDQISQEIKERRQIEIMQLQQEISRDIQRSRIGRIEEVLVEELLDETNSSYQYAGRSVGDAPEIDGVVYLQSSRALKLGEFAAVQITDALEYDLMGVMADEAESGQ